MDNRQRFLNICRFKKTDRVFLMPHWFWRETILRFQTEGMPDDVYPEEYFGFDRYESVPVSMGLIPPFEVDIIQDEGDYQVILDSDGAKKKVRKNKRELTMDQWLEYPIKNRQDWENYKKRLDPDSPQRFPRKWQWEDLKKVWQKRDFPLGIGAGSYYGWPRNWMGVENISIAFYDDPKLVHDMCNYIAEFVIEILKKVVKEVDLDFALIWEDMSYKTGPLCSPAQFKEFMVPAYKKVTKFLRKNGIDIILVDSDGNNDVIVPLWLSAGVNGLYPLEVAADSDAIKLRKQYGKQLILIGNIDKRALAQGKEAIKKEVMSKVPYLLDQGGYIPFVDHSVPHDVSLENFKYYLDLIKKIGGAKKLKF